MVPVFRADDGPAAVIQGYDPEMTWPRIDQAALAVQRGVLPPTANYEVPDPECDLDYVPRTAREQKVDVAVSVGSGFGGFQSAIVLARPSRRPAWRKRRCASR